MSRQDRNQIANLLLQNVSFWSCFSQLSGSSQSVVSVRDKWWCSKICELDDPISFVSNLFTALLTIATRNNSLRFLRNQFSWIIDKNLLHQNQCCTIFLHEFPWRENVRIERKTESTKETFVVKFTKCSSNREYYQMSFNLRPVVFL